MQAKIMSSILEHYAQSGNLIDSLEKACVAMNLDKNYYLLAYGNKLENLFDAYNNYVNDLIEREAKIPPIVNMRTTEKIIEISMLQFKIWRDHNDFIKSLITRNPTKFLKLFNNSSKIWYLAGDKATDWNYYSKRLLLNAALIPSFMFFFQDKNSNLAETRKFFVKKINLILSISKIKNTLNLKRLFEY